MPEYLLDDDIPTFPLHPAFRKAADLDDKNGEGDKEGEQGEGGSGSAQFNSLSAKIFYGDWVFDPSKFYIENVEHQTGFYLHKLNNYRKITKLIVALSQKNDWDVYGFNQVLNEVCKKYLSCNLEQFLNKFSFQEEVYINWLERQIKPRITIKQTI